MGGARGGGEGTGREARRRGRRDAGPRLLQLALGALHLGVGLVLVVLPREEEADLLPHRLLLHDRHLVGARFHRVEVRILGRRLGHAGRRLARVGALGNLEALAAALRLDV